MAIGGCDEHCPRANLVPFGGLHDLERRPPAENVGHQAAVTRVEVLHDDDGSGEVPWEVPQYLAQRGNATSRRGQRDDVKGCTGKRPGGLRQLDLIRLWCWPHLV